MKSRSGRDCYENILPPLGLALRLDAVPTGPLRASDLAQTFAHLHTAEDDDDPGDGNPCATPDSCGWAFD